MDRTVTPQQQLSELFGGYRAEWLKDQIFELFTEPSYFPELKTSRPCIIIGGRGTGKTTVLRGLSYQGQYAFSRSDAASVKGQPFYGMYYRANTNILTAFRGSGLTDAQWVPYFAHYINLLLCDLLLKFLEWYQLTTATVFDLDIGAFERVAASLNIAPPANFQQLATELDRSRLVFEAFVNNVADKDSPPLSTQGVPISTLVEELSETQAFEGKTFFFLIDEYENFLPYQQQVVNTLVKHSGEHYTFKICVRELGIHVRSTLNENEQLIHPADYARFDIADKLSGEQFRSFALAVCNKRIAEMQPEQEIIRDISSLLPGLTEEEEALRLDIESITEPLRNSLRRDATLRDIVEGVTPLKLYFLQAWATASEKLLRTTLLDYNSANQATWNVRFDNYKHALLFQLRPGKRGIRKYYCGWDTFTHLAASNIRYLLELVEQSLQRHIKGGYSLAEPVDPDQQTYAAQSVGKKNLTELEGLSVSGAQLTKLLLGLGRVFEQMAATSIEHAPEVNQFHLSTSEEWSDAPRSQSQKAARLLEAAVMHLALLRFPGTKLGTEGDTRDYDYTMHPIYSAFFVFSYRRKRKMSLSVEELLGLVSSPGRTIRSILRRSNRDEAPLPEQLEIFRAHYREDT